MECDGERASVVDREVPFRTITVSEPGRAHDGSAPDHGARCDEVHRALRRIAKARGALDVREATALREAESLEMWRRYGYGSLLEYMEFELGYSPRAAIERLRVAHALVELPNVALDLECGNLAFSAARELTRVATKDTEAEWLAAIAGKNLRQIEELVSGRRRGDRPTDEPDPSLRRKVLRYEVRPETYALARKVQLEIEKEKGMRLDDDALLGTLFQLWLDVKAAGGQPAMTGPVGDEVADDVAAPPDAVTSQDALTQPKAPDVEKLEPPPVVRYDAFRRRESPRYQIAVTVCERCQRGWQAGGGVVVEMTPAAVERARCDAIEIGSVDGTSVARARHTIPPAVRRKVKHRDQDRCRTPGCRSAWNVDIHHIVHRNRGGTDAIDNLVTLCEAHHQALHDGSLTIEVVGGGLRFERAGKNNFTRAERAVDTAAALKTLGFSREEISSAVTATRTHVGTEDLTLDQWIRIALGYLRKPR